MMAMLFLVSSPGPRLSFRLSAVLVVSARSNYMFLGYFTLSS